MQHNNPLKLRKFESVTLQFLGEIESSENSQILTFSSKAYGWRAALIELFRLYDAYKVRTPYHLAFCLYDKISVKVPREEFAKLAKAQCFGDDPAICGTLHESASAEISAYVSEIFRPRSISQADAQKNATLFFMNAALLMYERSVFKKKQRVFSNTDYYHNTLVINKMPAPPAQEMRDKEFGG